MYCIVPVQTAVPYVYASARPCVIGGGGGGDGGGLAGGELVDRQTTG